MLYSTVHAPLRRHTSDTQKSASICGMVPSMAFHPGAATLFAIAANVVANTCVGLAAPETVTVGAEATVVAVELLVSPMEKRDDVPNIVPMVELRKRT